MRRSARRAASRSCVTITTVTPNSRLTARKDSSTRSAETESSSAVGSSASSSIGVFDSATAMAARCCSPPESCPTLWFARSARSTSFSSSSAPRRRSDACPACSTPGRRTFSRTRQVRDEVPRGSLPHEPHAFGAIRGEVVVVQQPEVLSVHIHDPRGCPVEAAEQVQDRRLARAAGSDDGEELAAGDVQIHTAERDDARIADPIDLEHVPQACEHVASFGREPLGADHRHSASPRRTPVTDDRINVRMASPSPMAVVTATVDERDAEARPVHHEQRWRVRHAEARPDVRHHQAQEQVSESQARHDREPEQEPLLEHQRPPDLGALRAHGAERRELVVASTLGEVQARRRRR